MEVNRYHVYTSSSNINKTTGNTVENYTLTLKTPIILSNPNNYFKVVIKQATIPYVFYQSNVNYNTLAYSFVRNGISSGILNTQIPVGNYNIDSLITLVQTLLSGALYSYYGYSVNATLSITYNHDTMYCYFTLTGTDNLATYITIYADTSNVATMLGINTNSTFGYSALNISTSFYSTQPVNTTPITSVYIRSRTLLQTYGSVESLFMYNTTNNNNNSNRSDILLQIPITGQPTSWIQYQNELGIENIISNSSINDINLYLSDSRNLTLSLRGLDWSCLLTIIEMTPSDNNHAVATLQNVNMKNDGLPSMEQMVSAQSAQSAQSVNPEVSNFQLPLIPKP